VGVLELGVQHEVGDLILGCRLEVSHTGQLAASGAPQEPLSVQAMSPAGL
jgi:hypothetical protein